MRRHIILVLIIAIFAVFLFWPLYRIVRVAFFGDAAPGAPSQFTFDYLLAVFQDRQLRWGLINSARIAVGVTIVSTLISLPLAWLNVRYDFPAKRILGAMLLVPLILPPFVGAIGMRQILGRFGVLTSLSQSAHLIPEDTPVDWFGGARFFGIILIESLSLYPILLLNISAALANIDPAMEQAAANLGANRWRVFRKITFPLMRPGVLAGATIVMIWSFTELGTPLMFDFYQVTPVQIFFRLTQVNASPIPFALVVVMLLGSMLLYVIGKLLLGRGHGAATTKASVQSTTSRLRGWRGFLALLPFVIVVGLALLPHVGVILLSVAKVGSWYQSALPRVFTIQHYAAALTHDVTLPSVRNSIALASASTVLDLLIGIAIAWLIVRSDLPRFAKQSIDAMSMLPLAVPGLVLAFGYLAISVQLQAFEPIAHRKWLRDLVDVQQNPVLLLIIAYAMRRLPYVVRSAAAGLEQTPVDLELAAKNLGASGARTLRRITIPLISANLIAGALLAFAFAMLEVSDSLILAQQQRFWPITKAIYDLSGRLGDGPYIAAALGVWAMLLLTLTILSANRLLGRRMGAIFSV
ncbi:MAG: iron ABC transporter permease [Anaerolineae bacterium]|nr:iron ABC transporter permease [Phycisphaerae bacterium]